MNENFLKMSSLLCFVCHNTTNVGTKGDTREKYRDLVGMKLPSDSHLCHICCHLLHKLWLFKSTCLKRSMEYPVLFSAKGIIILNNSNTETTNLCPDSDECDANTQTHIYNFTMEQNENHYDNNYLNPYVLEDNLDTTMEVTKKLNVEESDEMNDKVDDDEKLISDEECVDEILGNDSIEADNEIEDSKSDANDIKDDLDATKEFHKVILSVEEQRAELEAKRREDKYLEAEFKCYNCALGFLFKDTYQAHMMRHEESNGEHLCPICTLRFASAAALRAHSTAHGARVWCARCGGGVRPRRLAAHRARCGGTQRAPCPQCGHTFPDANGLQQHIKRFHLSKTSSKTYSCNVCGKSYSNQAAVRTHMIKHINKKFTCDQCPSTFSSPYTLAQHRKKHSSDEEHRCETCNLSYKSRKSLLAHLRNSMSHQQTIYPCPLCPRGCPSPRALAAHIQTVHAAHRPHACALCGARYTSRKALRGHARAHAAPPAARAVCHLCGASFKGNSKLNRHLRSVCEKAKLEEELSALYNEELDKNNGNQLL